MTLTARRRGVTIIASAALAFGLAGLIASSDLALTARRGALVGSLMSFNRMGALVTAVLAVVSLLGVWLRARVLVVLAGGGFAAAAVLQLAQAGRSPNVLGGRPSTFSFFLAVAVGLLAIGTVPE